jgi:alpha-D-xyloside xylohydrolase
MVRPNSILPLGAVDDRPDYDYADGVTFRVYELAEGDLVCNVATPQRAQPVQLNIRRTGKHVAVRVAGESSARWRLQLAGTRTANVQKDVRTFADPFGIILQPVQGSRQFEFEL